MAGHPLGLTKASLLIVWTDSKKLPQLDCRLWLETYMHEIAIKDTEGMDLKKSGKGRMWGFRWRKGKGEVSSNYNFKNHYKNKQKPSKTKALACSCMPIISVLEGRGRLQIKSQSGLYEISSQWLQHNTTQHNTKQYYNRTINKQEKTDRQPDRQKDRQLAKQLGKGTFLERLMTQAPSPEVSSVNVNEESWLHRAVLTFPCAATPAWPCSPHHHKPH